MIFIIKTLGSGFKYSSFDYCVIWIFDTPIFLDHFYRGRLLLGLSVFFHGSEIHSEERVKKQQLNSSLLSFLDHCADPVQMPQNAASDQGQHCLYAKYNNNEKSPETPKTRNGLIQMMKLDKCTGQKRVKN